MDYSSQMSFLIYLNLIKPKLNQNLYFYVMLINSLFIPSKCKLNVLNDSSNYNFIPITFNNPLKVCFSNKKYPFTIQTRLIEIEKYISY